MSKQLPLALKYRPRSFADLTGQKAVRVVLAEMVKRGKVPQALLLTGPRGTGKTTTGRILAAALNCEAAAEDRPCGHCPMCKAIHGQSALCVIEQDAASNGLADDIRGLRNRIMYSTDGAFHVVILDEAHSMRDTAFNALLKLLEEPPPDTVFILITTEPNGILETVHSRCMEFAFRRISPSDIRARLAHICDEEGFSVEPGLLDLLAERAEGGMRDAVMTLDQLTSVGVKTVEGYGKLLGETDYAPSLISALSRAALGDAFSIVAEQLTRSGDPNAISSSVIKCLRDVMILKSGGNISCQGESLNLRIELAKRLELVQAFAACRILWDLATKFKTSEDPLSALDLTIVMLAEVMAPKQVIQKPTQAPTTMSLADMKR